MSRDDADKHHAEHDAAGGDDGRHPHLDDFLEREIKAKREKQKHHPDVSPHTDVGPVNHRHDVGHVRAD